jgi:NAD(P)-dependent dehydrogenase (short-subunit alcohol dehydrogenase family)
MAGQLEGKVALVTGAASGIGRMSALTLAREGAQVVVSDIRVEGGQQTVSLIEKADGQATFVQADVSKAGDVEAMIERTIESYGQLDYAFNNAGIEGELASTVDYSKDMWDRVLSVNLTGVWLCMKHEIPPMVRQGVGVIVNNASILGAVGFPNACAYTAAQHGILGLTKVAALEYATMGIRINAVCPGFIETPMVMQRGVEAAEDPETLQQLASLHPMGRMGKPEEVAQFVFLAH